MESPLSLEVDFMAGAGYLTYRVVPPGSHSKRTQRVSDDVFVDFDDEERVIGIELLAFDEEATSVAKDFAEAHNLSFPELLTRTPRGAA